MREDAIMAEKVEKPAEQERPSRQDGPSAAKRTENGPALEAVSVDGAELRFNEAGLIPCIVQDRADGCVLMMAWMNAESLRLTLETGETWFYSRSRQELWHKGATSSNVQRVIELRFDCDADALLAIVEPAGPACHTGARSCFYRRLQA